MGIDAITVLAQQPSISDWFALVSGFGGAIVGAIVGGGISYALARQTNKITKERDEAERLNKAKADGLKLSIKASLIASDVAATVAAIHEALSRANESRMTNQPLWQRMPPIIGIASKFTIDADELSPLIQAKEYDLFGEFVEVVMQHDALNQSLTLYGELRRALKEKVSKSTVVKGTLVSTALTQEEHARVAPYFLELESLAADIKPRSEKLLDRSKHLTFAIGPALRKHFGDPNLPIFVPEDMADDASQARAASGA